jgi:excisionase family DNA binding protein
MKKRQTPAPTVQAIHDAARVRITPLSVEEVAQRTGVSKFTVRGWIQDRKLESFKVGRRVIVDEAAVSRLLAAGRNPATEEMPR